MSLWKQQIVFVFVLAICFINLLELPGVDTLASRLMSLIGILGAYELKRDLKRGKMLLFIWGGAQSLLIMPYYNASQLIIMSIGVQYGSPNDGGLFLGVNFTGLIILFMLYLTLKIIGVPLSFESECKLPQKQGSSKIE